MPTKLNFGQLRLELEVKVKLKTFYHDKSEF